MNDSAKHKPHEVRKQRSRRSYPQGAASRSNGQMKLPGEVLQSTALSGSRW